MTTVVDQYVPTGWHLVTRGQPRPGDKYWKAGLSQGAFLPVTPGAELTRLPAAELAAQGTFIIRRDGE